jgi:hypothetical protein
MATQISFAGERQIIDMMKARGWAVQARPNPPKHQAITFRNHLPTLLFNGGEEKRAVTFHYDSDLYFRKNGVALFVSPAKGKVAFFTGWPDSAKEPQEAKVYGLNEFWSRLDDMAGEMKKGNETPGRPNPPNASKVWEAVQAVCGWRGPG